MANLVLLVGFLMLLERAWKHWSVVCFFQRATTPPPEYPERVSILQAILSGDPGLQQGLEHNLLFVSRYPREYIWLVDADDLEGQTICRELIDRHPERTVRLVITRIPQECENPKMIKLIAGAREARSPILCVLDDDTRLPDGGLEQCLPYLDQPGAGLAFGLPFYVSFHNRWSSLVAYFVNSNSLLTYIPYLRFTPPFTINGMFYALRRTVLDAVGGFDGLENTLADDFAIAQRVRRAGYRLVQTPLRHGISTHVTGPRHYVSLIQRWFIFPRESLLRHLGWRDQMLLGSLILLPALFPLILILALVLYPSRWLAGYGLVYFGYSYAIFAHLNARYLGHASPWRRSGWVPVIQAIFPIQLLIALLSPQNILWRGHLIQVEPGGGLRFVRRRTAANKREDPPA